MGSRLFISTTAISAILAAPAFAADPAIMAPLPVFTWTGFYAGAHAGFVNAGNTVEDGSAPGNQVLVGRRASLNSSGGLAGLQAGYNWQISSLVLGVEGDISLASLSRRAQLFDVTAGAFTTTYRTGLSSIGSLRLRAGVAFDRVLVYATGGVAFGNLRHSLSDPNFAPPSATLSRGSSATGLVIGGGVEYALTDNWIGRAEVLHARFPNKTVIAPLYTFTFKNSVTQARLGVNYKF